MPDVHHVSVFDQIVFAFEAECALGFCCGFRAGG
jgi:hypothetical protein